MIFFILFIINPALKDKLWIFLVVYSQCVLVLLFVWQLNWTEMFLEHSVWVSIVGLRHFDHLVLDMVWYMVIATFSVIQWKVKKVCLLLCCITATC